jgi:hypothetical protein
MRRWSTVLAILGLGFSRPSAAQWRIDPRPALDIGSAAGADEYLFKFVSDAVRLSNGNLVVVDANGKQIRIFDPTGRFLRAFGRHGEGPGEFRHPARLFLAPADTLVLYDDLGGRGLVSKFSADGRYLSRRSVDGQGVMTVAWPLHYTRGTLIVDGEEGESEERRAGEGSAAARPKGGRYPRAVGRSTDQRMTLIAAYPGMLRDKRGPWALTGRVAANDSLLFLTNGDSSLIRIIAHADRSPRGVILSDRPRHRVSAADIATWKERMRAMALQVPPGKERDRQVAEIEAEIRRTSFPEVFPYFADLLTDETGNLWVRHHTFSRLPTSWTVYSPSGRKLSDLQLPAGVTVLQLGRDFVVGRWMDDDDVHHVRVYRLMK